LTQLPLRSLFLHFFLISSLFSPAVFLFDFGFWTRIFRRTPEALVLNRIVFGFGVPLIAGIAGKQWSRLCCCKFNEHNGEVFDETIQKYEAD